MSPSKNKKNLAAVNTESQEKNPGNNLLRDTNVSGFKEEYVTQASDEIESRVKQKTSQEISRTKSRILGSLSKLDEFPLNWQLRTGKTRNVTATVPGMIFILKYATVSRSSRTVNLDPDVVLHVYGFINLRLCIPCVVLAELADSFPGWNEWFKVAKVSIWTIILKTTTQNEVKNADMQNVLHFERLKECCWEVSVIKSVCRIFCNRLRCCKFAQRKRWYQFLKKFAEFCLQNYWKNCAQKNLFCAKIG